MVEERGFIAEELAKDMREISVAEFFEKNKHFLGYENPTKSLVTVVKEGLDNILDACEDAGILPDVFISVKQVGVDRFKVDMEDNGPGIVESKVPFAFGKLLFGSKFHKLRQSVAKNERILIKENGIIKLVEIGSFIDSFIKDKEDIIDVSDLDLETISFDYSDYKIKWKKISHLIKHTNDEALYTIELESGRKIKVTGSHSIFVLNEKLGCIETKLSSEIEKGDYVVVARQIPTGNCLKEINVLDFLSLEILKNHACFINNLKEEVFDFIKEGGRKIYEGKRLFYLVDDKKIRSDYFQELRKNKKINAWIIKYFEIHKKFDLRDSKIITYSKGKTFEFPIFIKLDKDFAKFFGLWVAEGHLNYANFSITLDFGIKETNLVKEVQKIVKEEFYRELSIIKDQKKNKIRCKLGSLLLLYLLKSLGAKTGAKSKEVPWIIFNMGREEQLSFINYMILGDGYISKKKNWIIYTTTSKRLASDILFLFAMNEVIGTITKRKFKGLGKKTSTNYRIKVYGKELEKLGYKTINKTRRQLIFYFIPSSLVKDFGFRDLPERMDREKIKNFLRISYKKTAQRYFKILGSLIENKIPNIPNRKFYFSQLKDRGIINNDLSVSEQGICLLRKIDHIKRLLNSDFIFLKVKEIKKIKIKREPVYDISIPGSENFIAGLGGIVCHNTRGIMGVGIHGAVLYSQLTTGKPVKVTTSTGKDIHAFELMIDVTKNEPNVISHKKEKNPEKWHGVKIEMEVEGRYVEKGQSILEYIKQSAIANPHAHIAFDGPGGKVEFKRVTHELPKRPKEIKPHPYGIELGILRRMLAETKAKNLISFLTTEFSRVGRSSAEQICKLAKLEFSRKPQDLTTEESDRLHKAMQMVKLIAPPTDCLSPLTESLITEGLKKEIDAEYFVAISRPPTVYRGNPFQTSVGLAYGGNLPPNETVRLFRFANKIPLLYHQSDCAITEAIAEVDWRRYGLQQSTGALPAGPLAILVHFASVWVPFTSEGKQAIANYPEIVKEVKLALQDAGRKLAKYVSQKRRAREKLMRKQIFERYIPVVSESLAKLTGKDKKTILSKLEDMIKRKVEIKISELEKQIEPEKKKKSEKIRQTSLKEVKEVEGSKEKA